MFSTVLNVDLINVSRSVQSGAGLGTRKHNENRAEGVADGVQQAGIADRHGVGDVAFQWTTADERPRSRGLFDVSAGGSASGRDLGAGSARIPALHGDARVRAGDADGALRREREDQLGLIADDHVGPESQKGDRASDDHRAERFRHNFREVSIVNPKTSLSERLRELRWVIAVDQIQFVPTDDPLGAEFVDYWLDEMEGGAA